MIMSDNKQIAEMLRQLGMMLEILGENHFKFRSYYKAAEIIEKLQINLEELSRSGELIKIEGIGPAISKKITTIIETGNLPKLDEVKKSIPSGLLEMLKIPGMNPRKINLVWKKLDITNIDELLAACQENRLSQLRGFGKESQREILRYVEEHEA